MDNPNDNTETGPVIIRDDDQTELFPSSDSSAEEYKRRLSLKFEDAEIRLREQHDRGDDISYTYARANYLAYRYAITLFNQCFNQND